MPRTPRMKIKAVFSAKKEVTNSDAKKLDPLAKFWEEKIANAFDNGIKEGEGISRNTRAAWFLYGGLFSCALIGLLSFFGV